MSQPTTATTTTATAAATTTADARSRNGATLKKQNVIDALDNQLEQL